MKSRRRDNPDSGPHGGLITGAGGELNDAKFIDPEYLPFTEDELVIALRLAFPDDVARSLVADIVRLSESTERAQKAAAAALAAGSNDPAQVNPPSWFVSEEVFAILWCVSDFAERMDAAMQRRFHREEQSSLRSHMALRGLMPPTAPPEDLVRLVRRRTGRSRASWTRRKRAMADRLGVPRPDGTSG